MASCRAPLCKWQARGSRQQRRAKTCLSRLHLHLSLAQATACLRLIGSSETRSEDVGGLHFYSEWLTFSLSQAANNCASRADHLIPRNSLGFISKTSLGGHSPANVVRIKAVHQQETTTDPIIRIPLVAICVSRRLSVSIWALSDLPTCTCSRVNTVWRGIRRARSACSAGLFYFYAASPWLPSSGGTSRPSASVVRSFNMAGQPSRSRHGRSQC